MISIAFGPPRRRRAAHGDAGGRVLPVLTDRLRAVDEDNPCGYFESEPAKGLPRQPELIREAEGKAVSIVSSLLRPLRRGGECRVPARLKPCNVGNAAPGAHVPRAVRPAPAGHRGRFPGCDPPPRRPGFPRAGDPRRCPRWTSAPGARAAQGEAVRPLHRAAPRPAPDSAPRSRAHRRGPGPRRGLRGHDAPGGSGPVPPARGASLRTRSLTPAGAPPYHVLFGCTNAALRSGSRV